MTAAWRAATGLLLAALSAAPVFASQSTVPSSTPPSTMQPEVSFEFTRQGMDVPHYLLVLHEDGSGTYQADQAPVAQMQGSLQPAGAGTHVDHPITISHATTDSIFKDARAADHFNITCDSKAKNIANTGKKTLTYSGPDGRGTCTYNYSENKTITSLTDTFQAIAFMLDEGRKLEYLHRYDRLGLDAEMESLIHEFQEKRALEPGTIAAVLTSLVNDEALIQRVRTKAAKLLEVANDSK